MIKKMDECYSYLLLKNEEPIKSQEETLKKESKYSVNKKTNDEDFSISKKIPSNKLIKKSIKLKIVI